MAEQQSQDAPHSEPASEKPSRNRPGLHRLRLGLMILGPVLLIGFALWYYFAHQGTVSTEDAF
ncbi:MAG: hypothetical protein L0H83_15405, partial [Salinisphaera sp.]|nr:hypothetical protein [Salinisphaera sp.]